MAHHIRTLHSLWLTLKYTWSSSKGKGNEFNTNFQYFRWFVGTFFFGFFISPSSWFALFLPLFHTHTYTHPHRRTNTWAHLNKTVQTTSAQQWWWFTCVNGHLLLVHVRRRLPKQIPINHRQFMKTSRTKNNLLYFPIVKSWKLMSWARNISIFTTKPRTYKNGLKLRASAFKIEMSRAYERSFHDFPTEQRT